MPTRVGALAPVLLLLAAVPAQVAGSLNPSPWPGLHLSISVQGSARLDAIDLQGRVVHSWRSPVAGWNFVGMAKPLPGGRVLASIDNSGNPQRRLIELDWQGNVLWSHDPSAVGRVVHHDYARMRNGNTIYIARQLDTSQSVVAMPIWDEFIVEVDRGGSVVWEWSSAAHAAQMPVTPAGWSSLLPPSGVATLFHLNSVAVLPKNRWAATDPRFAPGNLLISYRELNLVAIIDKPTGNLVWQLYNRTIGQHHARMIPEDYQGAGNILLLDNGGLAGAPRLPFREHSRALEIDPPSQQVVWSYGDTPRQRFFTMFMGSTQRLPNGNTLITASNAGRAFEVTRGGQIAWSWTGPVTYRAYRVPLQWQTAASLSFPW